MSKAVMISIKPKWCELIESGKKTIEVRKTKPKIDVPFKCYIYCTNTFNRNGLFPKQTLWQNNKICNGKVIGEFICDKIDSYDDDTVHTHSQEDFTRWNDYELDKACIHEEDFEKYANGKWLYGWHMSDLVIYDEPKELGEFSRECKVYVYGNATATVPFMTISATKQLSRPPQSWGYVEELEGRDAAE